MFLKKFNKIFFFSLIFVLPLLIATQSVLAETEDESYQNAINKNPVSANAENPAIANLNETANVGALPKGDLPAMIGKIVGALLAFLGIAFFILIIYGGYTWMFSMGNEQDSGKAKNIIIAAIIGLFIVLMAYAITSYIGGIF